MDCNELAVSVEYGGVFALTLMAVVAEIHRGVKAR